MKSIHSNEIVASFTIHKADTADADLAAIHSGIVRELLELREMIG